MYLQHTQKFKNAKYGIGGNEGDTPEVVASGFLAQFDNIECFNLSNGQRVFRLTNMTEALRGKKHGKFANYLNPPNIRQFLPERLWPDKNTDRKALGTTLAKYRSELITTYDAEDFIDICIAFDNLMDSGQDMSEAQIEIAKRAKIFIKASGS